jgi:hypothetical protein
MDTLVDLEKETPTQMMIEDVETRRNLSMKAIEAIDEVDKEMLETRLMKPVKLISLIQGLHTTNRAKLEDKSGDPDL